VTHTVALCCVCGTSVLSSAVIAGTCLERTGHLFNYIHSNCVYNDKDDDDDRDDEEKVVAAEREVKEWNKKRNKTKMTKKNHSGLPAPGTCNYTEVGTAAVLHSMREVMWTLRKTSWFRSRNGGCSLPPPLPVQPLLKACIRAVDRCSRNQLTYTSPGPLYSGKGA
jgi:hypothetical protein